MPWQGSWNGGVFTGTYIDDDGTVFEGTWTPLASQDPPDGPPVLRPNPFDFGALPNGVLHQGPWQGSLGADGVWKGKYTESDGTVFQGSRTPPHR
jgi:hypothetical protein